MPLSSIARPVIITVAPPAPVQEVVPAPRRGREWAPGHYEWRRGRHQWVAGHWIKSRPGYAYSGPRWVERDGRWSMEQGRWMRGNRDNDGDGVRNRDDRRPNNPNRN
ncbi:MAG: hypothetical protein ABI919_11180 [Ramlibacter sp.]